ncbi:MAG: hypothetical protein IK024_09990, partial [Treponema sp.]|nr:hypothetical protein [Treponema sp.]
CVDNYADCDATPANGCEVDSLTSISYCGAKGSCSHNDSSNANYKGVDCSAIDNVNKVFCDEGTCYVVSCKTGFVVNDTNSGCVAQGD